MIRSGIPPHSQETRPADQQAGDGQFPGEADGGTRGQAAAQ